MSNIKKEISFAAGIMKLDEATKKVLADKRKGTVKIICNSDGEKPLTWTPEGATEHEFEYMVMQGDAKIELSKQMKRVAVLRFECDTSRYFFWLQNKDATQDADILNKAQEVIDFDVDTLMIEEPSQPIRAEQPVNVPARAPAPVPLPASNPVQPTVPTTNSLIDANLFGEQLQAMFNNMAQQQGLGGRNQLRDRRAETPHFQEVLTRDALTEISVDAEAQAALIPHLPEGQQNQQNLKENLQSPQFQQALDSLERALNSEEGAAVLASLGLDSSNFMQTLDGSDSFYKAILKLIADQKK